MALATLDRPADLARCLDALLGAERLPAEIIVVDQGTDHETPGVIEGRASSVPIIYLRQERRGLSASRNAAFARSRCPLVAVTDDDCVPDAGWVAAMARAFTRSPEIAAVSGRVLPLGPESPDRYAVASRPSAVGADFRGWAPPWRAGTGANFAVRRAALVALGGYDERLGAGSPGRAAEDLDVLHRLLRSGASIRYEPEALVYHQRKSAAERAATWTSYGHGVGAFCGLRVRSGDPSALRVLGAWLVLRGRMASGSALRLRGSGLREEWYTLTGTLQGLRYGLSAGGTHPSAASYP